jgi:ADP-ribose pyrophosphatase YjhB (NUDIX family)
MRQTSPDINAASVALIDGDQVLLIRRGRPPFEGLWTLPGGRLEVGETAEAAAVREIGEELGIAITAVTPVAVHAAGAWRLAVFVAHTFSGEVLPSPEVLDWRWVKQLEIQALNTTPGLSRIVHMAFAY